MKKLLLSLIITILFSSCAVKQNRDVGKYFPPNIDDTNFKNSVITNKNFDDTWTSVIDFVSGSFFNIENFEKDSGLLTLSFGSRDAENFIDCGDFELNTFTGQEFRGSYIDFATRRLKAVLVAKMNINIRKIDNESTKIRINTNYMFTTRSGGRYDRSQTYSFISGGYETKNVINPVSGSIPTRTCKSTNFAENAILNVIK